jgi:hypothetical protein
MNLIDSGESRWSTNRQIHLCRHDTHLQSWYLVSVLLGTIRQGDSPVQVVSQPRQYILFVQTSQVTSLVLLEQTSGEIDSASDRQFFLCIGLALATPGFGLLAEDCKGTSKSILCVPAVVLGTKLAKEDMDDIGLL